MQKIFGRAQKLICLLLVLSCLAVPVRAEQIRTSYYQIDGNTVRGVAPGTKGEKLTKVCSPDGLSAPSGDLATGSQLTGQGQTLTVIVTGDLNGDAKASITDLLLIKSYLLGSSLGDNAKAAADINYDGKVTITDFLRIKSYLLGMEQIAPGKTAAPTDPLILLMPGQSESWSVSGATAYISADETLATVADGKITAQSREGTVRVTALDAEGKEKGAVLVTVLNEKLTITAAQSSMRLIMGKSATISTQLNHPVQANVTWTSSNPAVATVNASGQVQSVKPGTAVITAALSNGNKAQVNLTVASPITAVETERTLYKVKPGNTKTVTLLQTPAQEEEVYTWTSSDTSIATVSNDGVVTGVKNGTVTITVRGQYSGLSASCNVKVCNVKQVAITFDDGPSNVTPQLLDFLKENDIRVTFFLVGNRISEFDDYVIRQAAEGHEIGYHSYSHAMQPTLSDAKIKSDFDKSNNLLKQLTGKEFTVWRTPGGDYNTRVLNAIALPHIMWSVDTLDWKHRNSSAVYASVVNVKDGSIVLMHDLYSSTATGAINAMKEMQAGDYEFLTVTELLSRDGTPPEASVSYARG